MIEIARDTTTNPQLPKLMIAINNGDLQGIEDVMAKWHFTDEASMLRFAIAVLLSASNNTLYADGPDGKKTTIKPAANLLRTAANRSPEASDNAAVPTITPPGHTTHRTTQE